MWEFENCIDLLDFEVLYLGNQCLKQGKNRSFQKRAVICELRVVNWDLDGRSQTWSYGESKFEYRTKSAWTVRLGNFGSSDFLLQETIKMNSYLKIPDQSQAFEWNLDDENQTVSVDQQQL